MKKGVSIIIIAVLAKILIFIVEIGPKAFISANEYGEYSYLLAQVLLIANLISFGGQNFLLKEGVKDNKDIKPYVYSLTLSVLMLLIIFVFSLTSIFDINYLVIIASFLLGVSLNNSTYFRCQGHIVTWYVFKDISRSLVFTILFSLLIINHSENYTQEIDVFDVYFISIFIAAILCSHFLFSSKILNLELWKSSIQLVVIRMKLSFPLIFTGFTYLLLSRFDSYYVSNFLGYKQLADYNAISRIMYQGLFFQQLILAKGLHIVAEYFSNNNFHDGKLYANKLRKKMLLLTVPSIIVILCVLNTPVVKDFLNITTDQALLLSIIFLTLHILSTYFSMYSYLLLYIGKQYHEIYNNIIIIIIAVILHNLLIPLFGLTGAAISTAVAIVLGNVMEKIQFNYFITKV